MRAGQVCMVLALTALTGGCAALEGLRDRLGFVSNVPALSPTTTATPPGPLIFAAYVLEAFPEARLVKIDPESPTLNLVSEAILTHSDPHLRRGAPRFSPDGRLIAYEEADREGADRKLIIRKLNGAAVRQVDITTGEIPSHLRRVGDEGLGPIPITWAPSSDAFAWTHETSLGAWELLVADLAGKPQKMTGPPAMVGSLSWSPEGDRIAFVSSTHNEEVWAADVSSHASKLLARAPGAIQSLAWSADGRRMVVSASVTTHHNLFSLDLSRPGEVFQALTRWPFDDLSPSISPDGSRVAFYTSFRPLGASEGWALAAVAADGSDPASGAALLSHVLAGNSSVHEGTPPPAWTPDGRWLAYAEPQSGEYHAIILVDVLHDNRNELSPNSITNEDITISGDGILAYRVPTDWGDNIVLGLAARGASRAEK